MLKRTGLSLSWPRLIGLVCGTFGAAVTVGTAVRVAAAGSLRPDALPELVAPLSGVVFLFLAFPLYTARDWARRALIVATYCILVGLAMLLSASMFQQSRPSAAYGFLRFVIGICALVSFLTPPAFLLAVLHHVDIRRAFQSHNASNQAMQRTAPRSDV